MLYYIMERWLRKAIINGFGFMPNIYKYQGQLYFELFGYLADVDAYTIYEIGEEQVLGLFEMETYCSQNIAISSYLSESDYREIEHF